MGYTRNEVESVTPGVESPNGQNTNNEVVAEAASEFNSDTVLFWFTIV